MNYISEHCTFAPITDELLSRLNDFYCHHETDISDFFKFKAVKASEELMSKSYCLYDDENNEMVTVFCVIIQFKDSLSPRKEDGTINDTLNDTLNADMLPVLLNYPK